MSNSSLRSAASGLCSVALQSMAIFTLVFIVAAGISAQAPFFDEAFANSAKPATNAGAWVITAKVSLNGHAFGKEYITARGPVTLQSDGMLGGNMPLSINNAAVADNTISIYIRPSNPAVVVLNRLIAGKPMLGRRAITVSLPVNPNFNYLSGPIKWFDGDREIRIDLESQFVKKPSPPSGVGSGAPIGARYLIGGYMRVSNSSDGAGDNTVEIYGILRLHHYINGKEVGTAKKLLEVVEQDADNGFQMSFNDIYIDAYDEDKVTIDLSGGFQDRDRLQGLTGDDGMFDGYTCLKNYRLFDLYRKTKLEGSMLCKGDQDSESADIRIYAKKVKDLYTR